MPSRPERVGDQIRSELAQLLAREVHDPGVGFLTLTHVKVNTTAQRDSARALKRTTPFLRRQLGQRLRLRRVPELEFFFDESIARQDRIEQILQDLKAEATSRDDTTGDDDAGEH